MGRRTTNAGFERPVLMHTWLSPSNSTFYNAFFALRVRRGGE